MTAILTFIGFIATVGAVVFLYDRYAKKWITDEIDKQ